MAWRAGAAEAAALLTCTPDACVSFSRTCDWAHRPTRDSPGVFRVAHAHLYSSVCRAVYELSSEGADGKERYFRKPWFMTTVMFVGMSFCLPLAYLEERAKARAARAPAAGASGEPLLPNGTDGEVRTPASCDLRCERLHRAREAVGSGWRERRHGGRAQAAKAKRPEWQEALMLSIPTVFDLVATVLMNIGLLTVTASVYQMMRGAEMLFAALFAILFLARRLNKFHFGGIACCVVGIALVGASSVLSGQGGTAVAVTQGQIILGMTLIVMSQAVQAAQITFEDYFMSQMAISPMKIVGYEGVVGASLMLFVMLPLVRLLPGALRLQGSFFSISLPEPCERATNGTTRCVCRRGGPRHSRGHGGHAAHDCAQRPPRGGARCADGGPARV